MKVGERARANFHTQHNRGKSKVYYQTGEFIRMDMVNDTECLHAWNEEGGRDIWWRTADADPIIDPVLLIQMRRPFQFFAPIFASWTAEDKKERDDYRHRVKLEMYFQGWWIINDCNESNDCKGSLFKVLLSCAMAYSAPSWNPFIVNHEKTLSAMQHRRVTN